MSTENSDILVRMIHQFCDQCSNGKPYSFLCKETKEHTSGFVGETNANINKHQPLIWVCPITVNTITTKHHVYPVMRE